VNIFELLFIFNFDNYLTRFLIKKGKVFVHEWAHYRYGVFDEYGTAKSSKYPLFYRKSGSNFIEPNICSNLPINLRDFSVWDMTDNATTCRIDPVTNNYNENCRFKFNSKIFKPSTSLASYHLLDSVNLNGNCRQTFDTVILK
jgi:hypothetical protein